MVLNCSPSVRRWRLWPGTLGPCKAWPSGHRLRRQGLDKDQRLRHPFHRAFDGEEGLDRPFPPTRFSKEAYDCVIYLKDRVTYTSTWVGDVLHHGPFLMDPLPLGTPPDTAELKREWYSPYLTLPQSAWNAISEDFKQCNEHTRDGDVPLTAGHRIRTLIHNALDIPDLALAEWTRLKKDRDLGDGDALKQLENQTKSAFCSSQNWSRDVYALFEALRDADIDSANPARKFAHTFLQSYPNLTPFLSVASVATNLSRKDPSIAQNDTMYGRFEAAALAKSKREAELAMQAYG